MQAEIPATESAVPGIPASRTQGQAVLATVGIAVLGPAVGSALARLLLPESVWTQVLGFFALPLVLGFGYKIWIAKLAAVAWDHLVSGWVRALWQILVRRRRPEMSDVLPTRETLLAMVRKGLEATAVFARVGFYFGILTGALAALAAGPGMALASGSAFFATSAAYGLALARLGRRGLLVFPETS